MHYHATQVSTLLVLGLGNQLQMTAVEELLNKQFPEIDRHTLWEAYNIALVALAVGTEGTGGIDPHHFNSTNSPRERLETMRVKQGKVSVPPPQAARPRAPATRKA